MSVLPPRTRSGPAEHPRPRLIWRSWSLAAIGLTTWLQVGCSHRHDPPNLVRGDAYFNWSNLHTYREETIGSTDSRVSQALEIGEMALMGRSALWMQFIGVPDAIHLTFLVKDTSGNVLASHGLKRGHNRWRDVILADPIDLSLHISSKWVEHELFLKRIVGPHGHAVNINVVDALMARLVP